MVDSDELSTFLSYFSVIIGLIYDFSLFRQQSDDVSIILFQLSLSHFMSSIDITSYLRFLPIKNIVLLQIQTHSYPKKGLLFSFHVDFGKKDILQGYLLIKRNCFRSFDGENELFLQKNKHFKQTGYCCKVKNFTTVTGLFKVFLFFLLTIWFYTRFSYQLFIYLIHQFGGNRV